MIRWDRMHSGVVDTTFAIVLISRGKTKNIGPGKTNIRRADITDVVEIECERLG